MWPRSDSFLGHIKKSLNIVPQVVIWDVCGTWHGVTSVHSIQKSTRNSQKLGNKLGQLFSECWQKIQLLKQREIELISKRVWRKRKEKMFRLGNLIAVPCEAISELLLKNICHQKMYLSTYLHSAGWWFDDEVAMYLLTYHQQTSLKKPMSKQKLFKK